MDNFRKKKKIKNFIIHFLMSLAIVIIIFHLQKPLLKKHILG